VLTPRSTPPASCRPTLRLSRRGPFSEESLSCQRTGPRRLEPRVRRRFQTSLNDAIPDNNLAMTESTTRTLHQCPVRQKRSSVYPYRCSSGDIGPLARANPEGRESVRRPPAAASRVHLATRELASTYFSLGTIWPIELRR